MHILDFNREPPKWDLFERGRMPNNLACVAYYVLWERYIIIFGGQSVKALDGGETPGKKSYSDRILVCDMEILFDKSIKERGCKERAWSQSRCKLPEPLNGVGVALIKHYEMHLFGGYTTEVRLPAGQSDTGLPNSGSLDYHCIYDVRDILKDMVKCELYEGVGC